MAKRKHSRRASQPHSNQGAGSSSSNTVLLSQIQETGTNRLAPRANDAQGPDASSPENAPAEDEPDVDDGFQTVERRRHVRSTSEWDAAGYSGGIQRYYAFNDYDDLHHNQYLDYIRSLFARLRDASAESRARAAPTTASYPPRQNPWSDETRENQPGPALAISVDDEHFPELGAPRRHIPDTASSSSGRLPWSAVMRPPPPAAATATHVPRRQHTPLPPPHPTPVVSPPHQHSPQDLRKLAEDASVLLELYSKTALDTDDSNRQLITSAFASVTTLNRHHSILASGGVQKRPENDDFTLDAACIICYSEVADTVLVPCHHLVLCGLCCDMIGVKGKGKEKSDGAGNTVLCPMCRTQVADRIKIFR